MNSAVSKLPTELLNYIFTFTEVKILGRCCLVCKVWDETIRKSKLIWLAHLQALPEPYSLQGEGEALRQRVKAHFVLERVEDADYLKAKTYCSHSLSPCFECQKKYSSTVSKIMEIGRKLTHDKKNEEFLRQWHNLMEVLNKKESIHRTLLYVRFDMEPST